MWRAIGRLIVIPIGLILASFLSLAILFTLGLERLTHAMGGLTNTPDDVDRVFQYWDAAVQGFMLFSGVTVLPALAAVVIGEVARIRSALYYILAGSAALIAVPLLANFDAGNASQTPDLAAILPIFATAGFAGGGLYWLIAGRGA